DCNFLGFIGNLEAAQRADMAGIMRNFALAEPLAQAAQEEFVVEIRTPQRAVTDSRFRQRSVEIQHPYQSGPFAAPVRDSEDRPKVGVKPAQNVMTVLPDRLDH